MPAFAEIQEEIAAMLAVPDEELTEEQRKAMDAYLDELAGQEADKVDSFAQFIRIQTDFAQACKDEAARLRAKAATAENRIAWLKDRYLGIMRANGLKKVKGNAYSLSVRESEQVEVDNLPYLKEAMPTMVHVKIMITPDKSAIRQAIKDGVAVPGARLQKNQSLVVR